MDELTIPSELLPLAFRRPDQARQKLTAVAEAQFGPASVLGTNVRAVIREDLVSVPYDKMWRGERDHIIQQSVADLTALLESVDPQRIKGLLGITDRKNRAKYSRMTAIRVAQLCDLLEEKRFRSGTIVEVGSLFGSFALPLARLGFKVTAIDRYSIFRGAFDAYIDLLRNEGVNVVSTTREDGELVLASMGQFDCVLAMAVIEHIPHTPRLFLQSLKHAARPSGIIALDTPNLARYWNRVYLNQGRTIFQPIEYQYHSSIPFEGHHREYVAAEMIWILEQIGCTQVSCRQFDYNMLQFDRIDRPHLNCLEAVLGDLTNADTILVAGTVN